MFQIILRSACWTVFPSKNSLNNLWNGSFDMSSSLIAMNEFTSFNLHDCTILYRHIFLCGISPQVIERLIDTGDSEQIFQKAIQEQGRGQVCFYLL